MAIVMFTTEFSDFLDWLEKAKFLLPGDMMLSEAREIFDRKVQCDRTIDSSKEIKINNNDIN